MNKVSIIGAGMTGATTAHTQPAIDPLNRSVSFLTGTSDEGGVRWIVPRQAEYWKKP
jgi:hypothetical protein